MNGKTSGGWLSTLMHQYLRHSRVHLSHAPTHSCTLLDKHAKHACALTGAHICLALSTWRDRDVYRQQHLLSDYQQQTAEHSIELLPKRPLNSSSPILKEFIFYQTGHHLQPIDILLLRNKSLLDRCLLLPLLLSLTPRLHPSLRWHLLTSVRIKVVYRFSGKYQEHVVRAHERTFTVC